MSSKLDYISITGLRSDGRRPMEIRQIRSRFGLFSKVDGSAYLEHGQTKVVAVVYGPREASHRADTFHDKALINCEFSQAAFSTTERKVKKIADRKHVEYSVALKQIYESVIQTHLYPRSQIDIFVEVLQADGGELAASINAVTLALINAGIAMEDFVVASTASSMSNTLITDLNYNEERADSPLLTVALMASSKKINLAQMESKIPLEEFENLIETATAGCDSVYEILQKAVQDHTWRLLNKRDSVN